MMLYRPETREALDFGVDLALSLWVSTPAYHLPEYARSRAAQSDPLRYQFDENDEAATSPGVVLVKGVTGGERGMAT